MQEKRFDVLITGGVADFDILLAEQLSRRGLKCGVARRIVSTKGRPRPSVDTYSSYHTHFAAGDVLLFKNGLDLLTLARNSRIIVSLTGALVGALGRALWPLRHVLALPPVINFTSGSDITELAAERSIRGILYRQYLRFVDLNWCVPYPHALKNILALKVPNVVFMRFPYYLVGGGVGLAPSEREGRIRFFHPSHLDWKVTDSGSHRNSSKGNDRFIRAFARAVHDGLDAECLFLDRGPDRAVAKELLADLGVGNRALWKAELRRDQLSRELHRADVVVDQFDVGGLGGIATEAMSVGKPLLIYLQENCIRLLYAEPPPVLNCHTEDEIYAQLMLCRDRTRLQEIGSRAQEWVYRHHDWSTCLDHFLFYFTHLTGCRVVDYGWDSDPYTEPGRTGAPR